MTDAVRDHASVQVPPSNEAELAAPLERFPRTTHIAAVRRLSRVNGWRSSLLILGIWAPLVGAMAWAAMMPHWWVFLIAGCVVASRIVGMGVLVHDASHYLLYKNRLVNDLVSDLLLAFPIGMTTGLYRRTHFQHHRFTNTKDDIDLVAQSTDSEWFEWPKNGREFCAVMARSLAGLNVHRAWVMYQHWAPWNHLREPLSPAFPLHTRVLYFVNMAGVYALIGWGFSVAPWTTGKLIALYLVPGVTLVNFSLRLRATAEHIGADSSEELRATRTVLPRWWERWLVSPFNVNHHLEHHLFPSVPGPNLGKLHRVLMQDDDFRSRAHLTRGYHGVLTELMASENQSGSADEPLGSLTAAPTRQPR
ncbi:Fatty acid desaturase [Posidoniimonas polymericola]|uniref:Fatty acid desaturase n=1 Tax=Posidoniimonas polymericola TaxID=2528002 RepID=A0A5C5YGF3_9BACT|nr:fatty acid desaturase family protein [Posidoniimonas polymericola]TWT73611.1 Fatty acid desaturase [Posidoniimonas polymericola]